MTTKTPRTGRPREELPPSWQKLNDAYGGKLSEALSVSHRMLRRWAISQTVAHVLARAAVARLAKEKQLPNPLCTMCWGLGHRTTTPEEKEETGADRVDCECTGV